MPTLCFGGSFNPIHNAHLACAESIGRAKGYERVLLIPNAQSPLKPDQASPVNASDRFAMCQLAADYANQAQSVVRLEVDDIEMRRPGLSYTIDTARLLHQQGFDSVHWLIGADMLMSLPKWHRPLELLREVHFVIMARPGVTIDWSALPPEFRHLQNQVVEAPLLNISATEIRNRVALGQPIDDLVPPPVASYIAQHALYRRLNSAADSAQTAACGCRRTLYDELFHMSNPCRPLGLDYGQIVVEHFLVGLADCVVAEAQRDCNSRPGRGMSGDGRRYLVPLVSATGRNGLAKKTGNAPLRGCG